MGCSYRTFPNGPFVNCFKRNVIRVQKHCYYFMRPGANLFLQKLTEARVQIIIWSSMRYSKVMKILRTYFREEMQQRIFKGSSTFYTLTLVVILGLLKHMSSIN
ncbi:hypothetical protein O6H91_20G062800 [Diphasiastrum complanatum]|uniref:Uncharacterized protein n=1 Tax=Diphasiastrum complanatum TaxID=34168 RepID=A0ACC2AR64_DIPCM|nr:hypothetical protein O6H91_20G062800 [Diphasiastrum complanatum]